MRGTRSPGGNDIEPSLTPPALRYRPEVDGCRAIAILLVVGYHVGLPWLPGGFVGVDVFFVISGYLITSLLVAEQRTAGRIDFAAFYARRVRRLLPALAVMIAAVLVAGAAILLPDRQRALAVSAVAGLFFSINFHFVHVHQGYFAEQSDLVPLLHLWTLAVEEQFYLIWPVALSILAVVARRTGRSIGRVGFAGIAIVSLVSFAIGIAWAGSHDNLAFLLLPGRAWQLGAGALLAWAPPIPARWATIARCCGLAAVTAAGMLLNDSLPYPSFMALLPVAGAVLLVVPAQAPGTADRWLGVGPAAGLGKLSYGWYLWHWPLLAFARQLWDRDVARDAGIALAALLIAALSYRWIERPFRERRLLSATPGRALASGAAALVTCCVLAAGTWRLADIPPAPGSVLAQYLAARGNAARDFAFCDAPGLPSRCVRGAAMPGPGILLWGDSHAAQLSLGLERAVRPAGAHVVMRTMGACSPAARDRAAAGSNIPARQCAAFNAMVGEEIPALKKAWDLRVVLLAGDWMIAGAGWEARLGQIVRSLRSAGLGVVLAEDLPLQPPNYVTCVLRRPERACALSRDAVDLRMAPADDALRRVAAQDRGVVLWSPRDALCPQRRCVAVFRGRLLYRNPTHLTLEGSALLTPTFAAIVPRR